MPTHSTPMAQPDKLLLRSSPTEDTSPEMGLLLGHALAMDYHTVVIATDMMKSSTMMKEALVSSLLASGVDVVDIGCTSAPVAGMSARLGDCCVYISEYREYGLISGYLLLNPDGGLFRKDQIRHLDKVFTDSKPMPDCKNIGSIRKINTAVEEYNVKLRSTLVERTASPIIVDCNCGTSAESAPQILNALGADVLSINAQRDLNYRSRSPSPDSDLHDLKTLLEGENGYIGVSINLIGTLMTVLDEKGRVITPEQVLALIIAYLKPQHVVVPNDVTSLIDDVFYGRIDLGMDTPFQREEGSESSIIKVAPDAGMVCESISENNADLGYFNGGYMFNNISVMADAIQATAILAQLSGNNSINRLLDSIPTYHSDRKRLRYQCTPEQFSRMMEENLPVLRCDNVSRDYGWRFDFDEGWTLIRFAKDSDDEIEIVSESTDRAFLIGLMEVASDLVESCLMGQ